MNGIRLVQLASEPIWRQLKMELDDALRLVRRVACRAQFLMEPLEPRVHCDASDLDTTFADAGIFWNQTPGLADLPTAVATQSDGKIIVAGFTVRGNRYFTLQRLNRDGSIDSTFGSNGSVAGADEFVVKAIALQSDGKIVVAGEQWHPGHSGDFTVTRYNADGSLDTSFGNSGLTYADFNGFGDQVFDVAIAPDGRIGVVGIAAREWDGIDGDDLGLMVLNPDGSLDTGFSGDGLVEKSFGTSSIYSRDFYAAIAFDNSGRVLVGGRTTDLTDATHWTDKSRLVRFDADGSLDQTFGEHGAVSLSLHTPNKSSDTSDGWVSDLLVELDGKIVAIGGDPIIARFNDDGTPDTTFGDAGAIAVAGGIPTWYRIEAYGGGYLFGATAAESGTTWIGSIARDGSAGVIVRASPTNFTRWFEGLALAFDAGKVVVAGRTAPTSFSPSKMNIDEWWDSNDVLVLRYKGLASDVAEPPPRQVPEEPPQEPEQPQNPPPPPQDSQPPDLPSPGEDDGSNDGNGSENPEPQTKAPLLFAGSRTVEAATQLKLSPFTFASFLTKPLFGESDDVLVSETNTLLV